MTQEEKYMKEAIRQAKKAAAVGDVPIGCVIVHEDKIIARAYNQRNKKKTTLAHAELLAHNTNISANTFFIFFFICSPAHFMIIFLFYHFNLYFTKKSVAESSSTTDFFTPDHK